MVAEESESPRPRGIIAGYDGSPGSDDALDWAVCEAALRGTPLTVCHAWAHGDAGVGATTAGANPARQRAEDILASGLRRARAGGASHEVRPLLVHQPPAQALCAQSDGADMVVVGSRGRGGLAGLLLGSVGLQVASHAHAPVTVVRGHWRAVPGQLPAPVVVGSDGSPNSQAALELAIKEAELRAVPLIAICALSDAAGVVGMASRVEADFSHALAKIQADHPDVLVQAKVEQGAPRSALLSATARAQLLVVGSRGRGGLQEMVLGSAALAVLHLARCPVCVVRHD